MLAPVYASGLKEAGNAPDQLLPVQLFNELRHSVSLVSGSAYFAGNLVRFA
jgi:hypothetical protein